MTPLRGPNATCTGSSAYPTKIHPLFNMLYRSFIILCRVRFSIRLPRAHRALGHVSSALQLGAEAPATPRADAAYVLAFFCRVRIGPWASFPNDCALSHASFRSVSRAWALTEGECGIGTVSRVPRTAIFRPSALVGR